MARSTSPNLSLGIEGAMWVPNVLLVLAFVLYLLIAHLAANRVQPLVTTDATTSRRIQQLERQLAMAPQRAEIVIELARLYAKAGEVPLSYDALRDAEQNGSRDPRFKMRLAMAYLEVGKNADGQRVMKAALEGCDHIHCPPAVRARLSIFSQVADIYVERNIDSRSDPGISAKVFDEVVRRVDKGTVEMIMRSAKRAQQRGGAGPTSTPAERRKR